MTLVSVSSGLLLYLGGLLVAAAAAKALAPVALERALITLLPTTVGKRSGLHSRRIARLTILVEAVTGALLVTVAVIPTATAVRLGLATSAVFVFGALLVAARQLARRRSPCACFGAAASASGRGTAARAWLLFSIAVAQLLVSCFVPAPGAGSRPWSVYVAAGLAAILTLAWERYRSEVSGDRVRSYARGFSGSSRRAFLSRGLGSVAALIGLAALRAPAALAGGGQRSCQDAFNLCYGCGFLLDQAQCCIDCYVACQNTGGGGCVPGVSCNGCWPGV